MRHVDEGQLHAWLDRDRSGLTADEAAELERHLASCAECRMRLEEARYVTMRAAEILAAAGPVQIREPDFEALAGRDDRRRVSGSRRVLVGLAWAASIVCAVGLGWWTREALRPAQVVFLTANAESTASGEAGVAQYSQAAGTPAEAEGRPAAGASDVAVALEREAGVGAPPVPTGGGAVDRAVVAPAAPPPAGRAGADVASITDPGQSQADAAATAPALAARGEEPVVVAGSAPPVAARAIDSVEAAGSPGISEVARAQAAPLALADAAPQQAPRATAESPSVVWAEVDRDEAEARLGMRLLTIPDLEIVRVEVTEAAGQVVVRVTQRLENGAALTLTQWRAGPEQADDVMRTDAGGVSVHRGDLRVTGSAPLDRASLEMLLTRLR